MKRLLFINVFLVFTMVVFAVHGPDKDEFISHYEGSEIIHDDRVGFEELPVVINDSSVKTVEGVLRRQWCQAPEGRSPLEVIRNFENALVSEGGEKLFATRKPGDVVIGEKELGEYFNTNRQDRGLATRHFSHTHFPDETSMPKIATTRTCISSCMRVPSDLN